MTMNKKLYNRMRKYFYRVMIKSDAYYAATYAFEGSGASCHQIDNRMCHSPPCCSSEVHQPRQRVSC